MSGNMTVEHQELIDKIKSMIVNISRIGLTPKEISNHANLFDDLGIDSNSVVELVLALEAEFGVSINEEDLEAELFQDVSKWSDLVRSKQARSREALSA